MFTRIEAIDYRCLREVSQPLNRFEILVGANASGKSTFLDVVGFLADYVSDGLDAAVERRTANFHDLVWGRRNGTFRIHVTAALPARMRTESGLNSIRLIVVTKLDTETEKVRVENELVELYAENDPKVSRITISRSGKVLALKSEDDRRDSVRNDQYGRYSGLTNLPQDDMFPASAWLRELLRDGVRTVALNAQDLMKPSPPGRGDQRRITGATLARSIAQLKADAPSRFQDWLSHVRTALPDVGGVNSVLREEDNHRYAMVEYENGVQVPSWMASEGTLRLLALTILAYLPDFEGVYLVEEPENGVHPTALETIYQSLSSVYDAQVLVASHSPILLNMAAPEQLLCFSKTNDGVKIVRGSDHPALQDWRNEVSLGTLAASGILG